MWQRLCTCVSHTNVAVAILYRTAYYIRCSIYIDYRTPLNKKVTSKEKFREKVGKIQEDFFLLHCCMKIDILFMLFYITRIYRYVFRNNVFYMITATCFDFMLYFSKHKCERIYNVCYIVTYMYIGYFRSFNVLGQILEKICGFSCLENDIL